MTNYIRVPFADSGDKDVVPVATQTDGSVSFVQGYPLSYSLDPETDTAAKRIERTKMNFLFNQISAAIQEIQQNGIAPFITSDDNGGTAFSYGAGVVVMYNGTAYQSLVANNTQLPTVAANWTPVSNQVNSVAIIPGTYGGDLNAITSQGLYSLTAAATNSPLSQTALLEHYERSGTARVQVWHSCSATAAVSNRHFIRVGTVTGGVTTWSTWTQTTLKPVELSGSQDANTLTEAGTFYAATWTNTPVSASAFLEVIATGAASTIKQQFTVAGTNTVYTRTLTGSAWTNWSQLVTTDNNPGTLIALKTITASGNWIPSPGTKRAEVLAVGGGAAGIDYVSSGSFQAGSGGGAGGMIQVMLTIIPASVAITIGSGGSNGGPGGSTVFGTICSAAGGLAGDRAATTANPPLQGAAGGTGGAYTADLTKCTLIAASRGGAGSPGLLLGETAIGGNGGNSVFGSGGKGPATSSNIVGNDAAIYGAGGSGAAKRVNNSDSGAGGLGSSGVVIIREYS